MKCLRCTYELAEGELICPRCGYLAVEDRSSTANLKTDLPRRSARNKNSTRDSSPIGQGIVLHIRGLQKRIEVTALSNLIMGRADPLNGIYPDVDLSSYGAEQRGVSRHHVRMHYENGQLMIADMESANGTFLNGEKLTPNEYRAVHDGDELTLGQLSIGVRYIV